MKNLFLWLILLVSFSAEAQLIGAGRRGVASSGSGTETDPTVSADIKAITSADLTNWRRTATGVMQASAFSARSSSTSNISIYSDLATGNVVFQAPGVAPSNNGNRLTVDGSTLLNGGVTVSGSILPTSTGSQFIGSAAMYYNALWGNSFLSATSVGIFGVSNNAAGVHIRQGSLAQLVAGFHPSGAGGFVQPAGVAPTPNGYMWSVYGTMLVTGKVNLSNVPVFADNAAASSLTVGDVYRTATGQLMIKF